MFEKKYYSYKSGLSIESNNSIFWQQIVLGIADYKVYNFYATRNLKYENIFVQIARNLSYKILKQTIYVFKLILI